MIGLTLGDVAGIGPEITFKALEKCGNAERFIIYADRRIVECYSSDVRLNFIDCVDEAKESCINVVDLKNIAPEDFEMGKVSAACGRAAWEAIRRVSEDALSGKLSCICTGPINKVSLQLSGVPYIDHTQILSALTGVKDPITMFSVDNLRVFFLTKHLSLIEACRAVNYENLVAYIPRCCECLKKLNIEGPLAVAGLNPHCGDGGLFGNEEAEIARAVNDCKALGLDVEGPIPADSVFASALKGRYAAVLSLYHDQGHIAAKTYSFERTISLTLGLPFLRISVDHGTAFDLAGSGLADCTGEEEVLSFALRYEDGAR